MKTEKRTDKNSSRGRFSIPLISFFVLLVIIFPGLHADNPPVEMWQVMLGGKGNDRGYDIQETADLGLIAVGYDGSHPQDIKDVYLVRLSADGDTLWTKTYGGAEDDYGCAVKQTADLGFIITGYTNSFGGQNDVYLIKTDPDGVVEWVRVYGGSDDDYGYDVHQTADLGYIVVGQTFSFGLGAGDGYLLRTDANGDTLWTKTFGGPFADAAQSVDVTFDQGYIITGSTNSFGAGNSDVFLIRTDINGDTLWTKTCGGAYDDGGNSVIETADLGFFIAGYTYSVTGGEDSDVYLLSIGSNGDFNWEQTYGDSGSYQYGYSAEETGDEGFVVGGSANATGGEDGDLYLMRTDSLGDTLWTKGEATLNTDVIYSAIQSSDGGYVVCGYYHNKNGTEGDDLWIRKYKIGTVGISEHESLHGYFSISQKGSNPFKDRTVIDYQLPRLSTINVAVYNHLGQAVRTLVQNEVYQAGRHTVVWDGKDDGGKNVSNGVYFLRFEAGLESATKKLVKIE